MWKIRHKKVQEKREVSKHQLDRVNTRLDKLDYRVKTIEQSLQVIKREV